MHTVPLHIHVDADLEVERMRAAGTPNSGSLHLSSPGTAARLVHSVVRPTGSSTSNDSMMLRPMQVWLSVI